MNLFLILALVLAWLVILVECWLGWQLLRQNGRILLRLDEQEKRLNELESGEGEEPTGLPLGSEAPAFELRDLSGERRSLAQYRGQPLLLIVFNPECGHCRELAPRLAAVAAGFQPAGEGGILPPGKNAHSTGSLESPGDSGPTQPDSAGLEARLTGRQGCPPPRWLILSTGDAQKNRQFFAGHELNGPVLLQQNGEVAKAYQTQGTPSGYLISPEGKIASKLAMGAEALLALASGSHRQPSTLDSPPEPSGNGDGRANRFGNRTLARSKIKRDGLKAGTQAPDFRLPRLDGRGELSLEEFRGRRVLLVFSDPHCGPCNALAPELEKFHREQKQNTRPPSPLPSPPGEGELLTTVEVMMISRGEPKDIRAKVKEHGLTFPVVQQQQWEISRRYAMFATPIAYLVDEAGIIVKDVAVGLDGIQALMHEAAKPMEVAAV